MIRIKKPGLPKLKLYALLIILAIAANDSTAQISIGKVDEGFIGFEQGLTKLNDSIFIVRGNCKNNSIFILHKEQLQETSIDPFVFIPQKESIPLIKVHGNIVYNFSYQSYMDTPFVQHNMVQHMVQISLNYVIKEKYPIRMILTHRNTNSPYFKNITDVNLQFNQKQLLYNIKTNLKNEALKKINVGDLSELEQLYASSKQYIRQLQNWLNSPARLQEIIEEKEKALRSTMPPIPNASILADKLGIGDEYHFISKLKNYQNSGDELLKEAQKKTTDTITQIAKKSFNSIITKHKITPLDSSYLEKYNAKKQELERIQVQLLQIEAKAKKLQKNIEDSAHKLQQQIGELKTASGIYSFMKKNAIAKDKLTKLQRFLLAINQIDIGRSWVDYSELTVKNVSLGGVNAEVNAGLFYFAAAVGKVNYRFRDFIIKHHKAVSNQSLYLIRVGVGQKEKNNFIVTFYNGKKAVLNYTTFNTPAAVQRVLGISAEARLAVDENNYIVAEVAKSSFNNNIIAQSSSDLLAKVFDLKNNTNLAYNIKLFSYSPQINMRLTAYYRKIGENFQSFNLNPIHINQDAWMVRINQYLCKKRFVLDAAIRKNDFTIPIAAPSFSTKTIFKSLQASLRIPKYPFVSVGYYPSSQLSLTNNLLTENQYNTINAVVSHSYSFKKTGMNTNVLYTKFYNSIRDTAFIYFNASSLTVNHSVFISRIMLQSSIGWMHQKSLSLFSLEQLLNYQLKNSITLAGGLKWTRLNKTESFLGGTASMGICLRKLGTIQFNYDKTYLPGNNRTLVPVDIGRMTFCREF